MSHQSLAGMAGLFYLHQPEIMIQRAIPSCKPSMELGMQGFLFFFVLIPKRCVLICVLLPAGSYVSEETCRELLETYIIHTIRIKIYTIF